MKILVAGPWCGSLHGELMCWQGWLRKISNLYDETYVVSTEDKTEIYSDFAKIIPSRDKAPKTHEFVTKSEVPIEWAGQQPFVRDQLLVPLGDIDKVYSKNRSNLEYEAVIEAPTRTACYTRYEWSKLTYNMSQLRDLAWVRTGAEKTQHVFGRDAREVNFQELLDITRKSKIAIALTPSMAALASLTGTPFLTISEDSINLWKSFWNPHKIPGMTWTSRPSIAQLEEGIKKLMDSWDANLYESPKYQDAPGSNG